MSEEIAKEAMDAIVRSYRELSKLLGCELSERVFEEVMREVVRISINEIARQLMYIKYPEIDDLPNNAYTVVNELLPAFLEKYVLDEVGVGGRDLEEVAEELNTLGIEGSSPELVNKLYEEFVKYVKKGKVDNFVKRLIREGRRLSKLGKKPGN